MLFLTWYTIVPLVFVLGCIVQAVRKPGTFWRRAGVYGLLAYLISDPELSLQSILITATIIGRLKVWVYVAWVALFSTLAGLIYGAWVDGVSLGLVALYLVGLLAILAGGLWLVERSYQAKAATI